MASTSDAMVRQRRPAGSSLFVVVVAIAATCPCAGHQGGERWKRQSVDDVSTVFRRRHVLLSGMRGGGGGGGDAQHEQLQAGAAAGGHGHGHGHEGSTESAGSADVDDNVVAATAVFTKVAVVHDVQSLTDNAQRHPLQSAAPAALLHTLSDSEAAQRRRTGHSAAPEAAEALPRGQPSAGGGGGGGAPSATAAVADALHDDDAPPDGQVSPPADGNELYDVDELYIYDVPHTEHYDAYGVDVWQRRAAVAHGRNASASAGGHEPAAPVIADVNDQRSAQLLLDDDVHERTARAKLPTAGGPAVGGAEAAARRGPAPPPRDVHGPAAVDRRPRQEAGQPPAIMPKDTPLGKPPAIRPFHTLKTSEERQEFRAEMERRALQWRRFRVLQSLRGNTGAGA